MFVFIYFSSCSQIADRTPATTRPPHNRRTTVDCRHRLPPQDCHPPPTAHQPQEGAVASELWAAILRWRLAGTVGGHVAAGDGRAAVGDGRLPTDSGSHRLVSHGRRLVGYE